MILGYVLKTMSFLSNNNVSTPPFCTTTVELKIQMKQDDYVYFETIQGSGVALVRLFTQWFPFLQFGYTYKIIPFLFYSTESFFLHAMMCMQTRTLLLNSRRNK